MSRGGCEYSSSILCVHVFLFAFDPLTHLPIKTLMPLLHKEMLRNPLMRNIW